MVGVLDYITDEFRDYHGDDVAEGLVRIAEADCVIFYNGKGYDIPVIVRLTEGLVTFDPECVVECLDLSRKHVRELDNHKLKTWGEIFEFPKGDHTDFSKWSEEMSEYCERDCRLTKKVFDFLNHLAKENGSVCLIEAAHSKAIRKLES